jgi:hypothetical protein
MGAQTAAADRAERSERLWTAEDGTTCLLVTSDTAPMYTITLVRNQKVLQERRLYGRSSARMLAESWNDARPRERT